MSLHVFYSLDTEPTVGLLSVCLPVFFECTLEKESGPPWWLRTDWAVAWEGGTDHCQRWLPNLEMMAGETAPQNKTLKLSSEWTVSLEYISSSGPQPFWHLRLVLWRTVFHGPGVRDGPLLLSCRCLTGPDRTGPPPTGWGPWPGVVPALPHFRQFGFISCDSFQCAEVCDNLASFLQFQTIKYNYSKY